MLLIRTRQMTELAGKILHAVLLIRTRQMTELAGKILHAVWV